jgi:predicted O-methyltransferase YrrM
MFKSMRAKVQALRGRPLVHFVLWQLGFAASETQTTDVERDCLARHAAGKKMLAEVGVFHGVTTRRLRGVMDSGGVLFAVDPYPKLRFGFSPYRVIARREVSKIKSGSVQWMRMTGAEAARSLYAEQPGPRFDFVFVDGDHSWEGIKGDWEGWSKLIAPGGIIAFHDSRSTPARQIDDAGSAQFTRQVIALDPDFETVDAVDSLTVLRRRGDRARA